MNTAHKFKAIICQQTKEAAIKKISENTKKIFTQNLSDLRKNRLSTQIQASMLKNKNKIQQQFSKQNYSTIAHQIAKQQWQNLWKNSQDYRSNEFLKQLLAQSQNHPLQAEHPNSTKNTKVTKVNSNQVKQTDISQNPPSYKQTIQKDTGTKEGKEEEFRTQIQKNQAIIKHQEPKEVHPNHQKRVNPFLSKSQIGTFANYQNNNTFSLFTQKQSNRPSQNNNPSTLFSTSLFKNQGPIIFNSNISSIQSNISSGIQHDLGFVIQSNQYQNQDRVNNSLQLQSDSKNSQPNLFQFK